MRTARAAARRSAWHRWAVVACFIALLSAGTWPAAAQVRDVPRGHWAYDAVTELVARGYLGTFDDGTFRGDEPVQRFTFAAALHQLLKEVEAGAARVDAADVELLRRLATEFRDELVAFYRLRDELLASVADSEKKVAVFDETLSRVIDVVSTLEQETETQKEYLARETEAIRRLLAGESEALRWELQEEADALRRLLAEETQALREEVGADRVVTQAALRGELLDMIAQLRSEAASITGRLSQLEKDVDEAWEETLWLSERLEEVYGQVEPMDQRLRSVEARADATESRLAAVQEGLSGLRAGLEEQREDLLGQMASLREGINALVEAEGSQLGERLAEARALIEQDVADLAQRLQDLQERLAQAEASVVLLDQRLQQESDQTRLALGNLLEDTELLLDASEALFGEVEALQGRLLALQDDMETRMAARIGQLESRVDDLDARGVEVASRIDGLEAQTASRVGALESRVEDLDRRGVLLGSALDLGLDELRGDLGNVRADIRSLEDRVGFSDEEFALLTDRVRDELAAQLNLSLMREQRLQRELEDLREEFDSYREAKEEETRSLRGSTTIAIAAAVIGILVGLLGN